MATKPEASGVESVTPHRLLSYLPPSRKRVPENESSGCLVVKQGMLYVAVANLPFLQRYSLKLLLDDRNLRGDAGYAHDYDPGS